MENWIRNTGKSPDGNLWVMVNHQSGWECEGYSRDFFWSLAAADPIIDYQIMPVAGKYRQTFVGKKNEPHPN